MHLGLTTLVVHEYDDAIRFFADALGFELVEDSPTTTDDGREKRWVVVRPPGAETGLLLARADGDEQSPRSGDSSPDASASSSTSTTSTRPASACSTTGSSSSARRGDEPYGRVAVFRDVAGNRSDLLGPPGRPV